MLAQEMKTMKCMRIFTVGILGLGIVIGLGVVIWDASVSVDRLIDPFTLLTLLWTISPFAVLGIGTWFCAFRSPHSRLSIAVMLASSLLAVGFGVLVLIDALIISLDPQSGLVLMVLPGVQLLGSIILTGLAIVIKIAANKASHPIAASRGEG
jgi:hypothetical protein